MTEEPKLVIPPFYGHVVGAVVMLCISALIIAGTVHLIRGLL